MKIMLVDLKYDYGVEERGLNSIGELGFKYSFLELGHEVSSFYYDGYLNDLDLLQQDLLEFAEQFNPDIIFFILFQDQFRRETLSTLKNKYCTVNWFGDDTWRFQSFSKLYAPFFTYIVTTDKFSLPLYEKLGIKNVIHSQWAALDYFSQSENSDLEVDYQYEVSFVGQFHPYRKWFLHQVSKKYDVKCFGRGWKNGAVSNEEMIKIFRSSKINLNISNSTSFDIRYLLRNPYNLINTFWSKKNREQIKARNFEIPYCGGFQLTGYTIGLDDYYDIGKDIACYSNCEDAMTMIDYYLKNEEERETMRISSQKKARSQHTYKQRLKEVLDQIIL